MWPKVFLICAVLVTCDLNRVFAAFQARIVNGTAAADGEFPFIVSLRRAVTGRHSCGASLLNRAWVLTAAHCVARAKPELLNIQYGSTQLDANNTLNVVNVSKIFVHEGYSPQNIYEHDIALLKLKQPISFNDDIQAVRLPEPQQYTPGNTSAILIGWGLNAVSLRHAVRGTHFCAGTIINSNWIMTAAHCFTYIRQPSELFVQYGSTLLNPAKAKHENVSQIIKHSGYNPTVIIHDIALLKLRQPMKLSKNSKVVQLPNFQQVYKEQESVILLGWGLSETNGPLQTTLQHVELQLVAQNICREALNSYLPASTLCAGTLGQGQCNGDSGGPLLQHNTQIGIISWSLKPCASKPGVFTNVAFYTDWINKVIS